MTLLHGHGSRIKCGGCGSEGTAEFSADENTLYVRNGSGRRVMGISGKFQASSRASCGIACDVCGSGDVWAA